jgi:hypothetical protein
MRRPGLRVFLMAALLPLAACATAELPMSYRPAIAPQPVAMARPVVAVGPVTDARTDGQANSAQFGTIRGGYGNPLRRLAAPVPVSEVVAQAFRDALAARGLLAAGAGGGFELRVRVLEYNANKLIRTEANVRFEGSLFSRATGAIAWTGEGRSDLVESGSFFATGIAADPEELRATTLRAMAAAIDAMLDRPDFVAALR